MGDMADQYGDDLYDSRDEFGHVVLPGGWHVPKSQAPEPFYPFAVPRGGIKYPASAEAQRRIARTNSQKEALMAKTSTQELALLREQQLGLARKIDALERRVKAQRTPPPTNQRAWRMLVQFVPGGKSYEYLILRVGAKMYTTGTGDSAQFGGWSSFMAWVDTLDWHGAMIPLKADFDAPEALKGSDD